MFMKEHLPPFPGQDAKGLAATLQQLIDMATEINFPGAEPPDLVADVGDYAPWDQVKDAIELKIPVSKSALYNRYGLPKPDADQEDDIFILPDLAPAISLADAAAGRSFFLQTKNQRPKN